MARLYNSKEETESGDKQTETKITI